MPTAERRPIVDEQQRTDSEQKTDQQAQGSTDSTAGNSVPVVTQAELNTTPNEVGYGHGV